MSTENVKKIKRGVNNATRGESHKKFNERTDMNTTYGLFIGHLDEIKITESVGKDDSQLRSFIGVNCPRLTLTFASNQEKEIDRKYVTMGFGPVESNADTIPGGKQEWKVNQIFDMLKHILNVFVLKGREMTEEEEDLLSLPFADFDENGDYVLVEAQVVADGYKQLFNNFKAIMDNNGKPYYKNANGTVLPIWMKLLRAMKGTNGKNKGKWIPLVNSGSTMGDLAFPQFVGSGIIEEFRQNAAPTLTIDKTKESVSPKEYNIEETPATPAGVIPAVAPGVVPGVQQVPNFGDFNPNSGFQGENGDLPF